MLKDLHIHIERGPYTLEWIEKFISKAQQMELDEICLLEHSIRFKDFHPTLKKQEIIIITKEGGLTKKPKLHIRLMNSKNLQAKCA